MPARRAGLPLAVLALWVQGAPVQGAQADTAPSVAVRFAAHAHFDRLVFALPPKAAYASRMEGTDLRIRLTGAGKLSGTGFAGRRMLGFTGKDGDLAIHLAPNTHPHVWQLNNRLVVDVDDGQAGDAPKGASGVASGVVRGVAQGLEQGLAQRLGGGGAAGSAKATVPLAAPLAAGSADTPAVAGAHQPAGSRVRTLAARRLVSAPPAAPVPAALKPVPLGTVIAEDLAAAGSGPEAEPRRAVGAGPPANAAGTPPAATPASGGPLGAAPGTPLTGTPLSGAIETDPQAAAPQRVAVTLLAQEPGQAGPSILVPFGAQTGAAAFGRGGQGHVAFDTARAVDLGQLKDDPVFGQVTEHVLPDGMQLSMPLASGAKLLLGRQPGGWSVTVAHGVPAQAAITARADQGALTLKAAAPGRVVVLDDETTGGKLLVGTQRVAGQAMPAGHRSAEFALLPSWQGVVVQPQSDRISLAPVREGFRLTATSGPRLSLLWEEGAGEVMTRRFDLADLPPEVLRNRLTLALRDAALTPRLARFPARLRVAQAMLAEGEDVEARAALRAAIADDPAHADDTDAAGLSAMAGWLMARAGGFYPPPPDNFDPARLGDSDEAQFWRALLNGGQTDVAGPAATLAVTWPMLQQYPAPLRRRILPAVGDILARGGQEKALAALLAAFADPSLDLVRAEALKRQGKIDDALAWLDAIAKRPDRLMRAAALREAVEMRLAAGKIDVAKAQAALSRQIYSWRGGPGDLALRLRVADLRAQAGQWRQAWALLRDTDAALPESHASVHDAETRLLSGLLHGDRAARLSALDLVALSEEAAPLLSDADTDGTLAPLLVDKLLALDLPARAEPILQRLYDHAASPRQKAELGVRLAGLLADRGDAGGALKVLDTGDDGDLPSELVGQRAMLRARLLIASGRQSDALGILSGVGSEAATELQAKILEDRHDWPSAAKLLEALAGAASFSARPEQAQRDLILRLANDESEAGDITALRKLRSAYAARFVSGPGAELFAVLTQEPIQAVDDLPRASRELQAVRALPASLATH